MKTLLALLVAILSLGAYFSGGEPPPDPEKPGCPYERCGCARFFGPRSTGPVVTTASALAVDDPPASE